MSKLIIVLLLAYLVYKIAKNAFFLALENLFGSKSLNPPEDLIKCAHCEKFTSRELVVRYKKQPFCSQECLDEYKNQTD